MVGGTWYPEVGVTDTVSLPSWGGGGVSEVTEVGKLVVLSVK